jgi:hypothetical protein
VFPVAQQLSDDVIGQKGRVGCCEDEGVDESLQIFFLSKKPH